jgi:hypothetical protein
MDRIDGLRPDLGLDVRRGTKLSFASPGQVQLNFGQD